MGSATLKFLSVLALFRKRLLLQIDKSSSFDLVPHIAIYTTHVDTRPITQH